MKELDLKNEEVQELLYNLEEYGYNEEVISGEIASAKKRQTGYTCERTYKKDGDTFKAIWLCASKFDGEYAYNELEECKEFYKVGE